MTAASTFHVSLNVADLARSIAFYRALLDLEPAKVRPDYAKFELADPPLVLSLNPAPSGAGPQRLAHLGIRVPSAAALDRVRERLAAAGVALEEEGETVCCYALQRKLWAADPDGNAWELYQLLADAEEHGGRGAPADAGAGAGERACCPGTTGLPT